MELHSTLPALLFLGAFLVAGLGVYQNLLRNIHESSGKVRTAELDIPDLLITLLLAGFFLMMIASFYLKGTGAAPPPMKPEQVLPGAIVFPLLVAGIVAFLRFRGVNLRRFFGFDRMAVPRALVVAVGLVIAAFPLVIASALLLQGVIHDAAKEQDLVTLFREVSSKSDVRSIFKIALAGVVLAPLAEEVLFRGYFYSVFKRYCGGIPSAIFTAALFAGVHLNLASLPSLFVLALCLTIAYEATGCLLVSIGMHALFNFTQLAYLFWDARSHGG